MAHNLCDVTVVINVYNGASTISTAIESLLSQTLKPKRILVFDNCSTDDTHDVVMRFPSVDYFLASEHTSLGSARASAMNLVKTNWIAFLDADDYWYPMKLEEQNPFLLPHVGVVYSSVEEHGPCGALLRTVTPSIPNGYQVDSLLRRWEISLVTAVINLSMLRHHYLTFDPHFRASEEQDLLLRLSCTAPFIALKNIHGVIVVSDKSLTNASLGLLGAERRLTLSKLQSDYPHCFSASAFSSSFRQSIYYDSLGYMQCGEIAEARKALISILRPFSLRYLLLFFLSLSPPLWRSFHSRPFKSRITKLLDCLL